MKTAYFFALLLICASGWSQNTNQNLENFKIIRMDKYSIACPGTWAVDTSRIFGLHISLNSPRSDSIDLFRESMNVVFQSLKNQGYSLSRIGSESESQIKAVMNDVSILESRIEDNSADPFYLLKYTTRQGNFLLTIIQRFYFKDEVGYALTFTMETAKEKVYTPVAEKMFGTFQLD